MSGKRGFCGQTVEVRAARAALHFWEEPCISGENGSGAVFFSGCSMGCVFCQNHDIALGKQGKAISTERLSEIFLELQEKGAHNINLVTGTHFIPQIVSALDRAKKQGLTVPIVYNTGSYETLDALKMLEGYIDIYLPDLKYFSPAVSNRYIDAKDYFSNASTAIKEMFRQVGTPKFQLSAADIDCNSSDTSLSDLSEQALMTKGVIIRHLLLPGHLEDSKNILSYLANTYHDTVFISLMNQYTPMSHILEGSDYPELQRKVSSEEYDALIDYCISLSLENVFIQEGETAKESFIPPFNYEGI